MKQVIGYCDPWSVAPGERIAFKVSCTGAAEYRADLLRIICGDDTPGGPGLDLRPIASAVNGSYPAREQRNPIGSYIVVADHAALRGGGSLTVACLAWPTTPTKGRQGLISHWCERTRAGFSLEIDANGAASFRAGDAETEIEVATSRPLATTYALVWFPPFDSSNQLGLFLYLLLASMMLRIALTLFDVPANALLPEITRNCEARTHLSAYKVSFTWVTSNVTGILMYALWLDDAGGAAGSGLLNRSGYESAGVVFAAGVLVAAAAVPIALRRFVPYLRATAAELHPPASKVLRNLIDTYSNRSIIALLLSAMFLAAASGLTGALWVYLYSFFFACTSAQVNVVQAVYLFAALTSLAIVPRLSRGRDKRSLALRIAAAFWLFTLTPYALKVAGAFPQASETAKIALLGAHAFVDGVLFNLLMTLMLSLLADVVEDSLLETGRREEGLILASQTFIAKTSSALGTALAALVLVLVAFPRGLAADTIPAVVLLDLGGAYIASMLGCGAISVFFLSRYGIMRQAYHRNLEKLEGRRIRPEIDECP